MTDALDRKAPKTGYDTINKAKYREHVWRTFSECLTTPASAKVVFLPSKEGLEIPLALRLGFAEENLFAIDDNPAVLATASWREKYPKVKIYGSKLGRAAERIFKDGHRIDAANLDLCGTISADMYANVSAFINSPVLQKESFISLTNIKGRESPEINALLNLVADAMGGKRSPDMNRACVMCSMAFGENDSFRSEELAVGEYLSGVRIYMQYAIFRLVKTENYYDYHTERIKSMVCKDLRQPIEDINNLKAQVYSITDSLHNTGYPHRGHSYFIIDDNIRQVREKAKGKFIFQQQPISDSRALELLEICLIKTDRIIDLQHHILEYIHQNTLYFDYGEATKEQMRFHYAHFGEMHEGVASFEEYYNDPDSGRDSAPSHLGMFFPINGWHYDTPDWYLPLENAFRFQGYKSINWGTYFHSYGTPENKEELLKLDSPDFSNLSVGDHF